MATIYHLLQELTPNAENFQHLIALSKQSTLNNRELKKIYNDALQARDLDTLANLMTISVDPARQMEVLKLMIKYKYNPEVVDSLLNIVHHLLSEQELNELKTYAYQKKADDIYVIIVKYLSELILVKLGEPVTDDLLTSLMISMVKNNAPYVVYTLMSETLSPVHFSNTFKGVQTVYALDDISNFLTVGKYTLYEMNLEPLVKQIDFRGTLQVKVKTAVMTSNYRLTNPFQEYQRDNDRFWEELLTNQIIKIQSKGLNIPIPISIPVLG